MELKGKGVVQIVMYQWVVGRRVVRVIQQREAPELAVHGGTVGQRPCFPGPGPPLLFEGRAAGGGHLLVGGPHPDQLGPGDTPGEDNKPVLQQQVRCGVRVRSSQVFQRRRLSPRAKDLQHGLEVHRLAKVAPSGGGVHQHGDLRHALGCELAAPVLVQHRQPRGIARPPLALRLSYCRQREGCRRPPYVWPRCGEANMLRQRP